MGTSWHQLKEHLLADPALKKAYDDLDPYYQVAREIYRVRLEYGLSQSELAKRIHTSQPMIARLESMDNSRVTLSTLKRIADALGLHLTIRFEAHRASA